MDNNLKEVLLAIVGLGSTAITLFIAYLTARERARARGRAARTYPVVRQSDLGGQVRQDLDQGHTEQRNNRPGGTSAGSTGDGPFEDQQ